MDDSELRGAAGVPEGKAAIQRDKAMPGKWASGNLVISSWDKCETPHWSNTGWALPGWAAALSKVTIGPALITKLD